MPFPGDTTLFDDPSARADGPAHDGDGATKWSSVDWEGNPSGWVITGGQFAVNSNDTGAVSAATSENICPIVPIASSGSGYLAYAAKVNATGRYWVIFQGLAWKLMKQVGTDESVTIDEHVAASSLSVGEQFAIRIYGDILEVYLFRGGAWIQEPILSAVDGDVTGPGRHGPIVGATNWRIGAISLADPAQAVPEAPVTIYVNGDTGDDSRNRAVASDPDTPVRTVMRAAMLAWGTPEWGDTIEVFPAENADPANSFDPAMYRPFDHASARKDQYPVGVPFGNNSGNEPITLRGVAVDGVRPKMPVPSGRGWKKWIVEGFQFGYDRGSGRDVFGLGQLDSCADLTFRENDFTSGAHQINTFHGTILYERNEVSAPLSAVPNPASLDGRAWGASDQSNDGSPFAFGHLIIRENVVHDVRGNDMLQFGTGATDDPVARVTIEDNLIYNVLEGDDIFHTDCIQLLGSARVEIRRNAFLGCTSAIIASDFHNGLVIIESNLFVGGNPITIQGTDELIIRHNTLVRLWSPADSIIFYSRFPMAERTKLTLENNIMGSIRYRDSLAAQLHPDSVIGPNMSINAPGGRVNPNRAETYLAGIPEFGTSGRLDDLPTETVLFGDTPANYELANTIVNPGLDAGVATGVEADRLGRPFPEPPDLGCHQSDEGTPVTPVARPPYVVGTFPAAGAVGVAGDVTPWADLYPKPGETVVVGGSGAAVMDAQGRPIPAVVSVTGLDGQGRQRISLDLKSSVSPETEGVLYPLVSYTAALSDAIVDTEGSRLAPTQWSFRVAGPSGPAIYGPDEGPVSGTFKLAADPRFPVGTELTVWETTGDGRAKGPVAATGTVGSDNTVTFSGLSPGTYYAAGPSLAGPFTFFRVYE